jgi:hypothetical protein
MSREMRCAWPLAPEIGLSGLAVFNSEAVPVIVQKNVRM